MLRNHEIIEFVECFFGFFRNLDLLWFFVIFLMYPSVSSLLFTSFIPEDFDQPGEDTSRLLRIDRSIDMRSPTYQYIFFVYAFILVAIIPLGVPFLYSLLLLKNRHVLSDLRRRELTRDTNYRTAQLKAYNTSDDDARQAAIGR